MNAFACIRPPPLCLFHCKLIPLIRIYFLFFHFSRKSKTKMFFSAPPAAAADAAHPSIQRLPAALASAMSSSASVPSLEAALAAALSAATTATATATATTVTTNKITVSFFNQGSSSASSSLSAASYSGFEVEDTGNGYGEAFLRGIATGADSEPGEKQAFPRKFLLHPLSSLASSASPSLPLFVSVASRPRGGFETRITEYSGGKLESIRLQPPPGKARPGANVRVSLSFSAAAAFPPAAAASAPLPSSSSSASSLVEVVLAFALAREDVKFTALDARTRKVLLKSEGRGNGGDGGNCGESESGDEGTPLVLRALGSPASPPSYSSAVVSSSSSSISARFWALVPPEGEIPASSSSSDGGSSSLCLRRRRCFVSVDGCPLEYPSLELEVDSLFAEICASLWGERRQGGGSRSSGGGSGGGGGGGGSHQKERGTAARARRVPAFVLKLSTTATAKASCGSGSDDAAPFCGRMGLPLLLSLGVAAEAAVRLCVREAALSCWRAVAPARLFPDPLLVLGMPLPPPPPLSSSQHHYQQPKRRRFDRNRSSIKSFSSNNSNAAAAAPPLRRAPRSAPVALISSLSSTSPSLNSNLAFASFHPRLTSVAAPSSQHPDSILSLDQLAAGARALVTPPRGFEDWGALSNTNSSSLAARPLSQLTAVDGRGSPTFLVAVVKSSSRTRQNQEQKQQKLLVIFDPHAAHERVRLELLTEAYLSPSSANGSSSLSLPLPRSCELRLLRDGDDAEALRKHAGGLSRWGWRWRTSLEGVEEEVVVVSLTHAAAVSGARLSAADFLDHARALLLSSTSSASSSFVATSLPPPAAPRALASRACRGAYMFSAGHRLSTAEASSLLDSLSRTGSPGICAHGRPTASALVDLGRVRAMVEARKEARRGGGGGGGGGGEGGKGEMMRATKNGRATPASSSSLSALVESLRLRVSRAERDN